MYSIIFNRNRSFRLNYSSGQISGTYSVTSNSSIVLNNIGSISNVQINNNQISFNLNITGLFQFNVTGSRVQTYQQNRTYIPDQNFEQALVDAGYDTTIDSYIDDSSMLGVTQLDLSNKQITDFTGLEEFVNLTDLNLSGNTITSVPLVNLNQLTTLNLSNTGLTELDLSQNSNITSLDLSGNTGLSCVKVSQQIYQQVPSGWIYDSTTRFELACDCPTLSLTSGEPIQELCDGDAMQSLVYEFGGTGTTINVGTMPSGLQSSISSGTLTISGTPVFTNNTYSFTVFTSDGNAGCSQVSQTVTISKKDSPELTLISGAYNQTISLGAGIVPIVVSYGGGTTGLTITGLPYTERGNTITISGDYLTGPFTAAGTYSATITTISSGGCTEITRNIQITIPYPGLGASPGGTTTGGTTTSGNTTTSGSTSSQAGIYFENGTCKCPNATVGDTEVINGTTYTVVNNSTIQGQVNAGNVNLCTTLVTNMSGIFNSKTTFNSNINFWDTSNVTDMNAIFYYALAFNQDISNWDTSNVINMHAMFRYTRDFNQNIGSWNTSSAKVMSYMFAETDSFNQDIGNWDTSSLVEDNNLSGGGGVFYMFNSAKAFNQNLTDWCVTNISSEPSNFSANSALTNANKPVWGTCPGG